jgi:hypothetical protein
LLLFLSFIVFIGRVGGYTHERITRVPPQQHQQQQPGQNAQRERVVFFSFFFFLFSMYLYNKMYKFPQ